MKNYTEELAYWYFRFNGFFLINNHVVHRFGEPNIFELPPNQAAAHSENDLLGIRLQFVSEGIGYPEHFCNNLHLFAPIETKIVGLICEVKGGNNDIPHNNNLRSQISRLGLYNQIEVDAISEFLAINSTYFDELHDIRIIKVLIRNRPAEQASWNVITINHVITFIRERFAWFQAQKVGGWDKFDSTVMQFMLKHQE